MTINSIVEDMRTRMSRVAGVPRGRRTRDHDHHGGTGVYVPDGAVLVHRPEAWWLARASDVRGLDLPWQGFDIEAERERSPHLSRRVGDHIYAIGQQLLFARNFVRVTPYHALVPHRLTDLTSDEEGFIRSWFSETVAEANYGWPNEIDWLTPAEGDWASTRDELTLSETIAPYLLWSHVDRECLPFPLRSGMVSCAWEQDRFTREQLNELIRRARRATPLPDEIAFRNPAYAGQVRAIAQTRIYRRPLSTLYADATSEVARRRRATKSAERTVTEGVTPF